MNCFDSIVIFGMKLVKVNCIYDYFYRYKIDNFMSNFSENNIVIFICIILM